MKRLIPVILVLACLLTLSACQNVPSGNEGGVQYVRTNGGNENAEYPYFTVIRSKRELMDYYEQNRKTYGMDSPYDESPAFCAAIQSYGSAYFKHRELLIVVMQENSGTIRHKVNFVRENQDEGTWEVSITSFVSMYLTDDMAQWHILVELPEGVHTQSSDDITLLLSEE